MCWKKFSYCLDFGSQSAKDPVSLAWLTSTVQSLIKGPKTALPEPHLQRPERGKCWVFQRYSARSYPVHKGNWCASSGCGFWAHCGDGRNLAQVGRRRYDPFLDWLVWFFINLFVSCFLSLVFNKSPMSCPQNDSSKTFSFFWTLLPSPRKQVVEKWWIPASA